MCVFVLLLRCSHLGTGRMTGVCNGACAATGVAPRSTDDILHAGPDVHTHTHTHMTAPFTRLVLSVMQLIMAASGNEWKAQQVGAYTSSASQRRLLLGLLGCSLLKPGKGEVLMLEQQ